MANFMDQPMGFGLSPYGGGTGSRATGMTALRIADFLVNRAKVKQLLEAAKGSPLDEYKKEQEKMQADIASKVSKIIAEDQTSATIRRRNLFESLRAGGFGAQGMAFANPDYLKDYARRLELEDAQMNALRLASALTGKQVPVEVGTVISKQGTPSAGDYVKAIREGQGVDFEPWRMTLNEQDRLRRAYESLGVKVKF